MDELVFSGNMRHEGLRMRTRDYVAIEEPLIGSFAVRIAAKRLLRRFLGAASPSGAASNCARPCDGGSPRGLNASEKAA